MRTETRVVAVLLAVLTHSFVIAADLDQELAALSRESDAAQYDTPDGDPRVKAFEVVQQHAANLQVKYPKSAEPLVWQAWALVDQSVVLRSLSSLGLLKQAKQKLEAALALDPNHAGANSTLGSLYFNVPKWPLSFGDRKKGSGYLQKALAIDPTSGWINLDYAKCLFKDDNYLGAVKHATIALNAPVHAGNKRDMSQHTEAEALIANAKEKSR